MKVNRQTGLLSGARFSPSPNQDQRPGKQLDLIVIHAISLPPGQFGGDYIEQFFNNQLDSAQHEYFSQISDLKVSSHLLIKRDGSLLQFVPFHKRAWHAGESCFEGRENCNDFSIGIELEGIDETAYEEEQYLVLAEVVQTLCDAYPGLGREKITGHCHIAPKRKTDPGPAFNWAHLQGLIDNLSTT